MRSIVTLSLTLSLLLPFSAFAEDDPAPHYEAGVKAEAARKFKEAVEHYDKVLDIDEDYKDAFDRWDACQALVAWEEELKGKAPKAPDLVKLGELYLGMGRFDDELKCYEEALAMDAGLTDAHGHIALWHYASGHSKVGFPAVYEETLKYLETSPYKAELAGAIADFEVYGALRNLGALLGDDARAAYRAGREKEYAEAARLYLKEADREGLAAGAKLYCLAQAAIALDRAGDGEAAKKALGRVLELPGCKLSIARELQSQLKDADDGAINHTQQIALAPLVTGKHMILDRAAQPPEGRTEQPCRVPGHVRLLEADLPLGPEQQARLPRRSADRARADLDVRPPNDILVPRRDHEREGRRRDELPGEIEKAYGRRTNRARKERQHKDRDRCRQRRGPSKPSDPEARERPQKIHRCGLALEILQGGFDQLPRAGQLSSGGLLVKLQCIDQAVLQSREGAANFGCRLEVRAGTNDPEQREKGKKNAHDHTGRHTDNARHDEGRTHRRTHRCEALQCKQQRRDRSDHQHAHEDSAQETAARLDDAHPVQSPPELGNDRMAGSPHGRSHRLLRQGGDYDVGPEAQSFLTLLLGVAMNLRIGPPIARIALDGVIEDEPTFTDDPEPARGQIIVLMRLGWPAGECKGGRVQRM